MTTGLINLFIDNLFPVLLIAAVGVVVRRVLKLDPRPLSEVTFHVFIPALVFSVLVSTQVAVLDVLKMVVLSTSVMVLVGLVGFGLGRVLDLRSKQVAALLLVVGFMNAGNLGLAVTQFSFGDEALIWATVFFVTLAMLTNSVGVYIASVGVSSAREALIGLTRVPVIYAILLALLLRGLGWDVPLPLMRAIDLVGAAAIPIMLVILGMQVARIKLPDSKVLLSAAIGLRLVVSPIIGLGLARWMGMTAVQTQAAVLEAAMPAAVLDTMLAVKFDLEPDFVAAAVLFSTLLSPFTLTPLIAYLGSL
jgi:predicted permease